jgi:hypothetical protein
MIDSWMVSELFSRQKEWTHDLKSWHFGVVWIHYTLHHNNMNRIINNI